MIGVGTVLSVMLMMPYLFAISTIFSMFGIEICGFESVSKNIALVLSSIKLSRSSAVSLSKTLASMPNLFSVCVKSTVVPP